MNLYFFRIFKRILMVVFLMIPSAAAGQSDLSKLYVIPVSGPVEPGMAAYVNRVLHEIKEDEKSVLLFKMDTFGGRVDAALDIVDAISNIPKGKTIAFVEKRAISAGALIALSSSRLYMKENTIIGDCAPIIATQQGQEMAGEKIQTVLRARFRALAKKNNYPPVLSESMVTIDMVVYRLEKNGEIFYLDKHDYDDLTEEEKKQFRSKKTIVAKGELLTMDDAEAIELGFSKKSVKDLDEVIRILGFTKDQVITVQESWSERLVRFLQPFLPVLMLIGVGALYTEIKAPGFGLPGILGIICLGLVFFNQYLVGLADITEVLFLLIGALLIGIEVFVLPGFGVAGVTGIICIAAGLVLAFQGFVIPDPDLPWEGKLLLRNLATVLGSFLGAILLSLFAIRYLLPQFSRVINGPYLETDLQDAHFNISDRLDVKPGDTGIAHTFLRPSGKIKINDKKIDAITQGEFIEQGVQVKVIGVEPNKVIVKRGKETGDRKPENGEGKTENRQGDK